MKIQNRKAGYTSQAEYFEDLFRVALEWILLYEHQGDPDTADGVMAYEGEAMALVMNMEAMEKKSETSFAAGIPILLEYTYRIFSLSQAERFVVMLLTAMELNRELKLRVAALDGSENGLPTAQLCFKIYTADPDRRMKGYKAIQKNRGPLSYFLANSPERLDQGMRLNPRILRFLLDFEEEDPELLGIARLVLPDAADLVLNKEAQTRWEWMERAVMEEPGPQVHYLWGPKGAGKKALVESVLSTAGKPVYVIDTESLKENENIGKRLKSICCELLLKDAIPCLTHFESVQETEEDGQAASKKAGLRRKLLNEILDVSRLVFVISEKEWKYGWEWEALRMDWQIPAPDMGGQIALWERFLEPLDTDSIDPQALAVRFSLTPGQMKEALREAKARARSEGRFGPETEDLYTACRRQLVMNLGSYVSQVKTQYTWEDLVLPDSQKQALKKACDQVEYQHQVYDLWGFHQKVAYGKGVSMLFYGPPGTGKTMGAQVIANHLKMELYKVDLSSIMSKYIGETEKNLGRIFDEIKKSKSILFFDEADALFGKRTEVKDSNDKYANAQTAYLLQKIEEYDGIVILASNYMQNFDEAFKRRIKFMIEFPFPMPEYRYRMWKQVFPDRLPLEELDYEYLAGRFELSGSSIKNIAVAAAFLAAGQGTRVAMNHILTALRDEMIKSGKSMPPESFGEYFELLNSVG